MSWQILYTKRAAADIPKLKAARLDGKARALIELLRENPYSRRINIKHRLVYEVLEEQKAVKLISMWTHYEF